MLMDWWRNKARLGMLRGLDAMNELPSVDVMPISEPHPILDVPRLPRRSVCDRMIAAVTTRSQTTD